MSDSECKNRSRQIVIFGAGGYARSVAEIISASANCDLCAHVVLDAIPESGSLDAPCWTEADFFSRADAPDKGVVAIGDGSVRAEVVERIVNNNPDFQFEKVIHPCATIASSAIIGDGSIVLANSVVSVNVKISQHVMIYSNVTIEHDCVLEDFSSIAPGVTVGGDVRIGTHSFVGLGAVLKHGITVGADTIVGANATVLDDQPSESTIVGTPARVVGARQRGMKFL